MRVTLNQNAIKALNQFANEYSMGMSTPNELIVKMAAELDNKSPVPKVVASEPEVVASKQRPDEVGRATKPDSSLPPCDKLDDDTIEQTVERFRGQLYDMRYTYKQFKAMKMFLITHDKKPLPNANGIEV